MPLTEKIEFKQKLQRQNRVEVPEIFCWQYKLETLQILKVTVNVAGYWSNQEMFLTRMRKDKRITIPKSVISRLKRNEASLEGCDVEITVEPV